ncbi:DUF7521 family protein [Halapricum desulfuricans]|uniref:Putative membrane protein n=1 Tax=Halapricum desulfuricans TaxID=2841257 RepID=A0A897N944_9EURY|nr:hypothetical protein [Halapricum desulfuricans]QSG07663.1 putative membrane protein [Halapricum desulfuricans]QSG13158.1 putative membrane protein [Halapricum desulfuricans]
MADLTIWAAQGVLMLLRLTLFGLSLGLTVISFQAYRSQRTERLQYAFIGFAFISMGVAVSNVVTQIGWMTETVELVRIFFQASETIPFIVGFAMLYLSLYR